MVQLLTIARSAAKSGAVGAIGQSRDFYDIKRAAPCTDVLQGPAPATASHDGLRWFHLRASSSLQTRAAAADAMNEAPFRALSAIHGSKVG